MSSLANIILFVALVVTSAMVALMYRKLKRFDRYHAEYQKVFDQTGAALIGAQKAVASFGSDPHQRIAGIDCQRCHSIEHDPIERCGNVCQGIAEVVAQLSERLALANSIAGAHRWVPAGGVLARHNMKCAQQRDRRLLSGRLERLGSQMPPRAAIKL